MGLVNKSCIVNKKKSLQAFDKSTLLISYCETSSDLDKSIIEFFEDDEEISLSTYQKKNSEPKYKLGTH